MHSYFTSSMPKRGQRIKFLIPVCLCIHVCVWIMYVSSNNNIVCVCSSIWCLFTRCDTYTHTKKCIFVCTLACVCVHACVYNSVYVAVHVCLYVCVHECIVCVSVRACLNVCVRVWIFMCVFALCKRAVYVYVFCVEKGRKYFCSLCWLSN